MNPNHYQRNITVKATPEQAYRALTTGYSHWWTATQDQVFEQTGDRIQFTFLPQTSYWTFEAKELIPAQKVVLECVEAYHIILDKPDVSKTEWLGSKAAWEIHPEGAQTQIHFTHEGLTPDLHCYDVCEAGWNLFFVKSLEAYLNTGTGMPHGAK